VAVDRADIIKAQLLEQGAAHRHAAREFVGLVRGAVQRLGQLARNLAGKFAHLQERFGRDDTREIGGQAPTGGAIDMSLSLRITTSRLPAWRALFIAS
jgi:hypothetical protein